MDKDAFYFPHFSNARHDRKIKRVIKELGVEGYGIFFMLLEVLREQLDFKYPLKDIDLLADEFKTSEEKVRVVILKYELFDKDDEEMFFSPKFDEYMKPYLKMKEQRREAGLKSAEKRRIQRSLNESCNIVDNVFERTFNEKQQSKVKESKVKESKKEHSAFFESVWILYPEKKGKGSISHTQKLKLEELGFEVIKKCIERYMRSKPSWQAYQNGSTFFNGGYIDYLDANYIEPIKKINGRLGVKEDTTILIRRSDY